MIEALEFLRAAISAADVGGVWLLLAVVAVALFFHVPRLRHPRYRWRVLVVLATAGLVLTSVTRRVVSLTDYPRLLVLGLVAGPGAYLVYISATKSLLPARCTLRRLDRLLKRGAAWDWDHLFDKKPIWLFSAVEVFRYGVLKVRYLTDREQLVRAYRVCKSIGEGSLLEGEKDLLKLREANLLARLGDVNRMKVTLEAVADKQSGRYLVAEAYLRELTGDFDGASAALRRALATIREGADAELAAVVYNQLARMSTLEHNWVDAIHYYRKATTAARTAGEKQLIHIAYHNLVHLCLRTGQRRDAENYLAEYQTLLDEDVTNDLVELTNLRLQVARQLGAQDDVKKEVDRGYELVVPRLKGERWLSFQLSALGVAYDSGLPVNDILSVIAQHFPEYQALDMPARYYALKELLRVLEGIWPGAGRVHAYRELHDAVLQYMRSDSCDDLTRYIQQLPDYAVLARCEMERQKVAVVKEHHQPYDFDQIYRMMQNIRDVYRISGLLVEAVRADLDMAEEAVRARRNDVIAEHTKSVEQSLSLLKGHPLSAEAFLRVSFYLFLIGRRQESVAYYRQFEDAGVSINHFAPWLQQYHAVLRRVFWHANPPPSK